MNAISIRWATPLFDCAWKSAALLITVVGVDLLLRRSSAATRHFIWLSAFGALIVLPVVRSVTPAWHLPIVFGVGGDDRRHAAEPTTYSPAQASVLRPLIVGSNHIGEYQNRGRWNLRALDEPNAKRPAISWQAALLAVWLIGLAALVLRWLADALRLRRIAQHSSCIEAGSETDLSVVAVLNRVQGKEPSHGSQMRVLIGSPHGPRTPMAWGWLRPIVYLPAGADEWPTAQREAVLLHETAHILRKDWPAQRAAQLVCALYWFNPLCWIAARRMRAESERACDDFVLEAGFRASDYAQMLLEVARTMKGSERLYGAVAMARAPRIEDRMKAILNPTTNRAGAARWKLIAVLFAVAAILLPLAAVKVAVKADPSQQNGQVGSTYLSDAALKSMKLQQDCGRNLKFIALAWGMYAQDYDDHMPPTSNAEQFRNLLLPYTKFVIQKDDNAVFFCPATGKEYVPNPAISCKPYYSLNDGIIVLRDSAPHPAVANYNRVFGERWNGVSVTGRVYPLNHATWTGPASDRMFWTVLPESAGRGRDAQLRMWLDIRQSVSEKLSATIRESGTKRPDGVALERMRVLIQQYQRADAKVRYLEGLKRR